MTSSIQGSQQLPMRREMRTPPTIEQLAQHMLERSGSGDGRGPDQLLGAIASATGTQQLTSDQLVAALSQFDANGDGTLGRDEFQALHTQLGIEMPQHGQRRGPGGPDGRGGPDPSQPIVISDMATRVAERFGRATTGDGTGANQARAAELLARVDANGDGAVSAEEVAADLTRYDSDGDGTLAGTELQAFHQAHAGARAGSESGDPTGSVDGGGTSGAVTDASGGTSLLSIDGLLAKIAELRQQLAELTAQVQASATAVQ